MVWVWKRSLLRTSISQSYESYSCAEKSKGTDKGHVINKPPEISITSVDFCSSCFIFLHTCRSAELLQQCLAVSCPRVAISSLPLVFFLPARCGERILATKAFAFLSEE